MKPNAISRFDRACLAHRLREEIEQAFIGICLANQAHISRLQAEGSGEASDAQRIQELLVNNVRRLEDLVCALEPSPSR